MEDDDINPQITLIGMSNIGKSHWADKLAKSGYKKIGCDVLIAKKLGYNDTDALAKWLGQPFDLQYTHNSRKYLEHERTVLREVLEELLFDEEDTSFVIDATGSVIHAGDEIIKELRDLTLVVYLEHSPEHVDQLFQKYLKEPKPVIWGSSFQPRGTEAAMDTLKRCYPDLLAARAALYKKMAHVVIPYAQHSQAGADLMGLIQKQKML